jgi:hypothetical protein
MPSRGNKRRNRGRRRWLRIGAILLLAVGILTAWQVWHVRESLLHAQADLEKMTRSFTVADVAGAKQHLEDAQGRTAAARLHTRGPVWWVGSHLPVVGDDITAIRTVASLSRDVTQQALPPLVEAGQVLGGDAMRPVGGRIDLEVFDEVAPDLAVGSQRVRASAQAASEISSTSLLPPVKTQVDYFKRELNAAAEGTRILTKVAEMMPALMGESGPRDYLLIFQNNGSTRHLGGMAGAAAVLHVDHGRLSLGKQGSAGDIGMYDAPVTGQGPQERALFGPTVVSESADVANLTHYPRNGEVFQALWKKTQGDDVDGVLSMDTVAVAGLLKATGPVIVDGRKVTSGNAVDELLHTTYVRLGPEAQNKFYEDVTRAVFDKIKAGKFSPTELARSLRAIVEERRLMLWIDNAQEQRQIADTVIANELPSEEGPRPEVGVYVNSVGNDKLSYFLRHRVDVSADRCNLGAQRIIVKLTLRSRVPKGTDYPPSVVGPPQPPREAGEMLISNYTYAPVGGRVDSISVDGVEQPLNVRPHMGREVGAAVVRIPRGETHVVEYVLYSPRGQGRDPHVITTPGVAGDGLGRIGGSAC